MAGWLKQSTSVTVKVGPFVDDTDFKTAETALTIQKADVRLSKNGGNIAAASADQGASDAGAAHDELGFYDISFDTTDTNTLGRLDLIIKESGALVVADSWMIAPANVWDSLFGADKLQVHADEITAGLITATAIATGAIDADAIADNAIDAGAIAADAITAAKIADGAIDAATFAAGAITATVIATGAIDADALATDAVAEIVDAVWDEDATGHQTGGTFGQAIGDPGADTNTIFKAVVTDATGATVGADVAAILDDTGTSGVVVASIADNAITAAAVADGAIDAATFAAGAIDATAIAANAIGASELAADAATEIADALLDRNMATGTDSGSTTVRTVRQALRALRNKSGIAGGTLTVTKEDDSTTSWTAAVTTAAGDPISEIDPAGP
jgi:hypothetical protein